MGRHTYPCGRCGTQGCTWFRHSHGYACARSRAAAAEFTGAFLKSVHWEFQEGGPARKGTRSALHRDMLFPDIIGSFRLDQAWGVFQLSAVAHGNHVAYFGATEPTGHPDDKWGFAVSAALSIKNIPTGPGDVINLQASLRMVQPAITSRACSRNHSRCMAAAISRIRAWALPV